jgi:thiol-disulfide isomerase/thioredoxin
MEALISRMMALGPSAKRPPHIALESDMRRPVLLSALLLASTGGCNKQTPPPPQAQAAAATPVVAPKQADVSSKGKTAPSIEFKDGAGKTVKLADFKGKPLLVNMWATWCVPCVKELPALDALAAQSPGLQVVAVSEDMEGARVVTPFLAKRGLKTLKPYLDTSNALLLALKEPGLPVSILYDANGKEVWRMRGDMEWTGPQAKALIAQAG